MKNFLLISLVIIVLASCNNYDATPLPRGYFRINLPEHEYQKSDSTFPYVFEYPVYSDLINANRNQNQKYWVNIVYPQFKATVFLSYKPVNNNLETYLEDSYTLVSKHIPKAENISDSMFIDRAGNKFGLIYKIEGSGAASPYQFFVTDSASHFLRGALYFNIKPNNDSLDPVIEFISKDLDHLVNTLEWN